MSNKQIISNQPKTKSSAVANNIRLKKQDPAIQRSLLSNLMEMVWESGNKGAFFNYLRTIRNPDMDLIIYVCTNLHGDDFWLASNIMSYGPEKGWPLHLKIEREMKGWSDCGGVPAVLDLLRQAKGSHASDMNVLTAILVELAGATKYERWLALQLMKYGPEKSFPMNAGIMNFFYKMGEEKVIETLINKGYTVMTFTHAYDIWQYKKSKKIITVDLSKRLRGNTDLEYATIRLNAALSHSAAAMTLHHELGHVTSAEPDYLEQEIEVRIASEQFAIDNGLPPTRKNYRKPDGTVDKAAIRKSVIESDHYNPKNRDRLKRIYKGEHVIGPWELPY